MLSDEEKEIFNNLKNYMQKNIDNGYHKFIYNDLDWDFKCIDCINAIDNALKQSKEIERTNEIIIWKQRHEEQLQKEIERLKDKLNKIYNETDNKNSQLVKALNYKLFMEDKIKAKIEEVDEEIKVKREIAKNPMDRVSGRLLTDSIVELEKTKKVLQSLLEKE